ncbi:hypothetical protein WICPIJ_005560 [Wickerhamomyces pijperi]|uniref:Uncharacterized protein n=1 Tax=Wickerhamomyces pijperi TaxID=599730 RepID=A0A9P8TLQ4_WICPI|nr:hypothetical protein WICPIJ_005560 [Wickerhamomyces pijperi]
MMKIVAIPVRAETPRLTINKAIPMIIGTGMVNKVGKNVSPISILAISVLIKAISLPFGNLDAVEEVCLMDFERICLVSKVLALAPTNLP